jgi:hypothetical protein
MSTVPLIVLKQKSKGSFTSLAYYDIVDVIMPNLKEEFLLAFPSSQSNT